MTYRGEFIKPAKANYGFINAGLFTLRYIQEFFSPGGLKFVNLSC